MKIIDINTDKYWNDRVNFVDDNNVLLGYEMGQSCCERADWFVADEIAKALPYDLAPLKPSELPGFQFDTAFFQEIDRLSDGSYNDLVDGGMAVFRLVNGDQEKFLHIFNSHNGYYGHGFDFKVGDAVIKEGCL